MKTVTECLNQFKGCYFLISTILLFVFIVPSYGQIPAFPGAEGMGAYSIGGREGVVIKVTNLNDSGPGSLRDAVEFSGPRIVVFEVSGIIDLDSGLHIINPFITIAGETSPGGILITGWPFRIITHDVIMRHVRLRNGCRKCFTAGNCETQGDTLSIYGHPAPFGSTERQDAYNIIVDHCSISWGCDETFDFAAENALVKNITVSNCIIAEGVNDAHPEANHARGLFMWGKNTLENETIRVSFYKNLIMSFYSRLPLANYNVSFDFVNNVVYNFNSINGPLVEQITGYTVETNMIHNFIKPGPNSFAPWNGTVGGSEMRVHGDGSNGHVTGTPFEMIYSIGNFGYYRQDQSAPEWVTTEGWSPTDLLETVYQRLTPFDSPGGIPITITAMSEVYADAIVNDTGAAKPFPDSVDTRLKNEYAAGDQGDYIDMNEVVFPTFQNLPPPIDNDNDGMADSWEVTQGFDLLIDDSALDQDGDGYTNVEEYLHFLAGFDGTLSLNELVYGKDVLIVPNPALDFFTINLKDDTDTIEKVIIFNVLGKKVKTLTSKIIDTSYLQDGKYIIKIITTGGKTLVKKMIKL